MATSRRSGRTRQRREVAAVRALERGLSLLETLARSPRLALTALAQETGLPASTAYRLLETMRRRGFVQYVPEAGVYQLGVRAFEVGNAFVQTLGLHEAALPAMRRLVEEVNETVNLAVRDGTEAVYVGQVEGQHLVRMFTQIGTRAPLYCTGVGKALLAWADPADVAALFRDGPLQAYTPRTITDPERLAAELDRVRAAGFALDDEERELGVRCIAAPIRGRAGQVVAALSLSAPASRLSDARVAELAPRVMATARAISRNLGWAGDPLSGDVPTPPSSGS